MQRKGLEGSRGGKRNPEVSLQQVHFFCCCLFILRETEREKEREGEWEGQRERRENPKQAPHCQHRA